MLLASPLALITRSLQLGLETLGLGLSGAGIGESVRHERCSGGDANIMVARMYQIISHPIARPTAESTHHRTCAAATSPLSCSSAAVTDCRSAARSAFFLCASLCALASSAACVMEAAVAASSLATSSACRGCQ